MSKLKCIIVEDELPGLTYLKMLCEQLTFVEVVKCFSSAQNLIQEYEQIEFEICLLDINMPGMSGMELAKRLKDKYIIFVSAHPEFAIDSYELDAVDFIKKPVVLERLEKALGKAYKLITDKGVNKSYFNWNTSLGKSIIYFEDIVSIATSDIDRRDKEILLKDDQTLLLKNITIDKLISILPPDTFIQINKAEIISRRYISSYSGDDIILNFPQSSKGKHSVSLGEAYRKKFISWIK